ncbi:hydrogenase 3 maturation endopeptidase HyCI [Candidatus Bathyarchaeota archaeon]|nr:hydrogenase 3 maturation endopeptidase HyCI [Candidatus Bathyarchaeota archaeon]
MKVTLAEYLLSWLRNANRVMILGIGNPMRGDDAVGVEIVKMLRGRVPGCVKLLECQTVPENFIGDIIRFKPSHVLMIDAGQFGASPGETRLFPPERISGIAISTHNMPLRILSRILEETVSANVLLLAIQPKNTSFDEAMSLEVLEASKAVADMLSEVLWKSLQQR